MTNMYEYYMTLGIDKTAGDLKIKKAYRDMAKKYHPDSHPGDTKVQKKFQEINEAYSVLSDSKKRRQYDEAQRKLSTGAKEKPEKPQRTSPAHAGAPPDLASVQAGFERFFGFNPENGEITNKEKLKPKPKNPLDASDLFNKFMGMK